LEGKITAQKSRSKSAHLMCGSKTWTIVAFLSCAYFAKVAIGRLAAGGLPWSHDTVDIVTHMVWMIFLVGLLTETRCWKEWVFFSLVLLNFAMASVSGLWKSAPANVVVRSRELSAAIWGLAALLSLVLVFMPGERAASEKTGRP
jgi:hypothetical protein